MAYKSNMLFDVLENILSRKSDEMYKQHVKSDDFKDASGFMIRRYLTMHPNTQVQDLVLSNYLLLEKMTTDKVYYWCLKNVPRQRTTFIKYIR